MKRKPAHAHALLAVRTPTSAFRNTYRRLAGVHSKTECQKPANFFFDESALSLSIFNLSVLNLSLIFLQSIYLSALGMDLCVSVLQSLARALAALVEARRGSESFQLILITHDEHFVMQLSRHGLCDKFYKIHKTLNGDSRISSCELQGF